MRLPIAIIVLALSLEGLASPQRAHGQLSGSTLQLQYYFPDRSGPSANYGTAVVGGGIEWTGVTIGASIDVGPSSVRVFWAGSVSYNGCCAFNGVRISDPFDTAVSFTGFSDYFYDGDPSRAAPRITVEENSIWIDWGGGLMHGGNSVSFTMHTAPTSVVPEPASILLMATGLATLGGSALRRRRRLASKQLRG